LVLQKLEVRLHLDPGGMPATANSSPRRRRLADGAHRSCGARKQRAFEALPCRCWVVEHIFAWLRRYRCLGKHHEALPQTSKAPIPIARINLVVHRLAPG